MSSICDRLDFGQMLGRDDNRHRVLRGIRDRPDVSQEALARDDIKVGERLVQHQQLRLGQQGADQFEPDLVAAGDFVPCRVSEPQKFIAREVPVNELAQILVPLPVGRGDIVEIVPQAAVPLVGQLGHRGDLALDSRPVGSAAFSSAREAGIAYAPGRWQEFAHHHAQEGCLPARIPSGDRDDLAAANIKRHRVQSEPALAKRA
jgi:hypothetical protein